MGERSGTRPAAQECGFVAIGGEEASSDCRGEVCRCQGDCPQCNSEDSKMRRRMRAGALAATAR